MTALLVLRTDAQIVSRSSGRKLRRSTTSIDTPSASNWRATSKAITVERE